MRTDRASPELSIFRPRVLNPMSGGQRAKLGLDGAR